MTKSKGNYPNPKGQGLYIAFLRLYKIYEIHEVLGECFKKGWQRGPAEGYSFITVNGIRVKRDR